MTIDSVEPFTESDIDKMLVALRRLYNDGYHASDPMEENYVLT
jgi:hypothetical protein